MKIKRLIISIALGALLGLVCIIGAQIRTGFTNGPIFLVAFFYNRVLMGTVIGLFERPKNINVALIRGSIIGLMVSFAFFLSTGFDDVIGFMAGIIYGIIIESVLYHITKPSDSQSSR